MFKPLIPALALALVPFVAAAQETESQTAPVQADQPPTQELSPSGHPIGQRYLKERFEDWNLACVATPNDQDPCSMIQVIADSQGTPIAEITMYRLKTGDVKAVANVMVPLETMLQAQVTVALGENLGKRYPYELCTPVGCLAQIPLREDDIELMKSETKGTISVVHAQNPRAPLAMGFSLNGFTAAFEQVDQVDNES